MAAASVLIGPEQDQDSFRYLVHIKAAGRFPFAVCAFVSLLEGNFFYNCSFPAFDDFIPEDSRFAATAFKTLFWFCHFLYLLGCPLWGFHANESQKGPVEP